MKIYHANTLVNPFEEHPKFPDEYTFVANVEVETLDEAYARSQNISSMSWVKNNKVKSNLSECRSTSVGDVIEDNDGSLWYCEMIGWKKF